MSKSFIVSVMLVTILIGVFYLYPDTVFAQVYGGGFESKMQNLTTKLVNVVLPLVSILGLVYAVILSVSGDGSGKGRVITVIVMSVVGFLAPVIIRWFQSATT